MDGDKSPFVIGKTMPCP